MKALRADGIRLDMGRSSLTILGRSGNGNFKRDWAPGGWASSTWPVELMELTAP